MTDTGYPPVHRMVREAIQALGSPTTDDAIHAWVNEHCPGTKPQTLQRQIYRCTVNQPGRVHWHPNKGPRQADNPDYDFLFRNDIRELELYDPEQRGHWAIRRAEGGKLVVGRAGDAATEVEPPPVARPTRDVPVRQMVREAAEALDTPFTNAEIKAHVLRHYPDTNEGTIECVISVCTVNQQSRVQYPENQTPRTADDPRYDFLYRVARGRRALYDLERHGTWRIARDASGALVVCCDADVPMTPESTPEAVVPLLASQIEAATWLHERVMTWAAAEAAFDRLSREMPGFELSVALIKAAAINDLYSTNVYAIWRMAQHLSEVAPALPDDPVAAVDSIAALPPTEGKKGHTHRSFASKVAHFFIDPERFPLYDSYCERMVTYHLGRSGCVSDPENPYRAFKANIDRLREHCGFSVSYRDLDRYLWLAGQYREFLDKGDDAPTNAELRTLFEDQSPEVQRDLGELVPHRDDGE